MPNAAINYVNKTTFSTTTSLIRFLVADASLSTSRQSEVFYPLTASSRCSTVN